MLLHAVDVSHPTKDWDLHREWTARCMEEFFKQGDQEREMGLDISPLCDRTTTQVPQSQIGRCLCIIRGVSPPKSHCEGLIKRI